MRRAAVALVVCSIVVAGCGGARATRRSLDVRLRDPAARGSSLGCTFVVNTPIAGGGSSSTCLTSVAGFPGAGAVIRSGGRMTLTLPHGTLRARVRVVQRFGADGRHARQQLAGTIIGGSGDFSGARGTITGGGTLVDSRTGLSDVELRYRVDIHRKN